MTAETPTVNLFVRSLSPVGAHDHPAEIIKRLASLTEAGTVNDYSVTVWGKEVQLSSDVTLEEREGLVLDRITELRSWAAERGVALDAFERREVSTVTGETYTVLTLPVMVLVESIKDEPTCVTPCTTDSGVLTVEDRLGWLEAYRGDSGCHGDRETSREDRRGGPREYDPIPS